LGDLTVALLSKVYLNWNFWFDCASMEEVMVYPHTEGMVVGRYCVCTTFPEGSTSLIHVVPKESAVEFGLAMPF